MTSDIPIKKEKRDKDASCHIIRNNQRYGLQQLLLQEKIEGKRSVGRRRISW